MGAAIKYEFSKFYAILEIFENYGTFPLIRVGVRGGSLGVQLFCLIRGEASTYTQSFKEFC